MMTPSATATAEVQALLSSAHAAKDGQLVSAIIGGAHDAKGSATPVLPPKALAQGIPATVIDLVAQRGQAMLLQRLLSLNEGLLGTTRSAASAFASPKKLTDAQKREHALGECVSSWVEKALLSGDRALVSAAVPEYESALSNGSLLRPPLADAVPALVRRGDV